MKRDFTKLKLEWLRTHSMSPSTRALQIEHGITLIKEFITLVRKIFSHLRKGGKIL